MTIKKKNETTDRKKRLFLLLLLFLSIVALVAAMLFYFDHSNDTQSLPVSPQVVIATSAPSGRTDNVAIPTSTPSSLQETSRYGEWSFGQSDFRVLPPSVAARTESKVASCGVCTVTYTEGNFKFFSQSHCIATDEQNNTWVIPFPFWVDACKFVRISHPSVKQRVVLTVTNPLSSVVQIEPGKEKACCVVGDHCYDLGDPFPADNPPCLYVIDVTWDGQKGFLIGGDQKLVPYTWCWMQIDGGRVLTQTLKQYRPQLNIPPGWSAYGNILYFHKFPSDTCVDMSDDVPVEKTCQ